MNLEVIDYKGLAIRLGAACGTFSDFIAARPT